jgi:hypothetical protein
VGSRYIELHGGVIVEVGSPGEGRQEMHNATLERVESSLEIVGGLIEKIVTPIRKAFIDLKQAADVPIEVASAEVQLGLSFSAEGNVFVTKAKAEGSLNLKIIFQTVKPMSLAPVKVGNAP